MPAKNRLKPTETAPPQKSSQVNETVVKEEKLEDLEKKPKRGRPPKSDKNENTPKQTKLTKMEEKALTKQRSPSESSKSSKSSNNEEQKKPLKKEKALSKEKLTKKISPAKKEIIPKVEETAMIEEPPKTAKRGPKPKDKLLNGVSGEPQAKATKKTKTTDATKSGVSPNDTPAKKKVEEKIVSKQKKESDGVDSSVPNKELYRVYETPEKIYSCLLTQTAGKQNTNKFYFLQILETENTPKQYSVFIRQGRVGANGAYTLFPMASLEKAISDFNKKYQEKIAKGEYKENDDLVESVEKKKVNAKEEINKEKCELENSKLSKPLKEIIKLICNPKMFEDHMIDSGYDIKKVQLDKLSKTAIDSGYTILNKISKELCKPKLSNSTIEDLSSEFYTQIPHTSGTAKSSNNVIKDHEMIKKKLEMLQSLEYIQAAFKLFETPKIQDNFIDESYKKLECQIEPISSSDKEYKIIQTYLTNTHGYTHDSYKLEILNLFKTQREADKKFKKEISNKILLWHGSRLTNIASILSQGLKIPPQNAPITGYMFGKGLYFADMASKAANSCRTSPSRNIGILLLCEVAIGNANKLTYADFYANNLPKNMHSTIGVGKMGPKDYIELEGTKVFQGKCVDAGVGSTSLIYNEYVVYDVSQVKIKYLVQCKFNYK